eukprot:CAMPEP_0172191824 /NCGR_PEP_ID=MMETSP1050-20130122/23949_1 /TAXON_ID=233186 /ORGANISM="Cryptomonas curvata, Strain CCAP979/52" /LENGTH=240 /DNA_ID=CAMNT_0012866983 /DNA_START=32 /DNA_END=751 /DNA_ORIENTATION=+
MSLTRKIGAALMLCAIFVGRTSAQNPYLDDQKALIHQAAVEKRAQSSLRPQSAFQTPGASSKCCTVAMFLSTATDLPNTGDSAHIARSAMACCREILCSKFHTEESCQWISSGDTTWKSDLSSDLDQVEAIDERLRQISSDDLEDPDAQNERASLLAEREGIETREIARVQKVEPLTRMCDAVMDPDVVGSGSAKEQQEARITCVSMFVSLASDSCEWQPAQRTCASVVPPKGLADYLPS